MSSINKREYDRNYGFWNEKEQDILNKSKVAIAGVGGDGFQLGYKLAMMGVGSFSIADPEIFEEENSNRVMGATSSHLGRNKAEVFRDMVADMRPETTVDIYTEGISEDNLTDFTRNANLVIDETELTKLELGTMLAREARRKAIPDLLVMNIGFAAIATSFKPYYYRGKTFEDIMGIPKDAPLDEVADMEVDFSRCLPYVPRYGDLETLKAVKKGADLPSISPGVDVASAIGSTEAFLHLVSDSNNKRRKPVWAPNFRYMDSYNGESGTIRTPRLSYYLGMVAAISSSVMNLSPSASYDEKSRKRRNMK
ncbi:MAG: ThiF family adenylyltransferase [Candidatus Saccharimonadales bacterium]